MAATDDNERRKINAADALKAQARKTQAELRVAGKAEGRPRQGGGKRMPWEVGRISFSPLRIPAYIMLGVILVNSCEV